jgi:hypothetical protein
MSEMSKRSTVYFEKEIRQALRIQATTTHQSVSGFVNEAVRVACVRTRLSRLDRSLAIDRSLMNLSIGGVNIYDIRYLSDRVADVHPRHHQSC